MLKPADKSTVIPVILSIFLGNLLLALSTNATLTIHLTVTLLFLFLMVSATLVANTFRKKRATVPARNARKQNIHR